MIRQFYANPPAYSEEVQNAYAFPNAKQLNAWKEDRQTRANGRSFWSYLNTRNVLELSGLLIAMKCTYDFMGPNGDALKIIVNKRMPRVKYYGLRIVPFVIFFSILQSHRAEISFPNPYSTGELK